MNPKVKETLRWTARAVTAWNIYTSVQDLRKKRSPWHLLPLIRSTTILVESFNPKDRFFGKKD